MNLYEKARVFLKARQLAYLATFNPQNQSGRVVLEDLAKFCRANATCFHENARATDIMLGRREVWLRIQQHLRLSDDELWAIYGNNQLPSHQGDD